MSADGVDAGGASDAKPDVTVSITYSEVRTVTAAAELRAVPDAAPQPAAFGADSTATIEKLALTAIDAGQGFKAEFADGSKIESTQSVERPSTFGDRLAVEVIAGLVVEGAVEGAKKLADIDVPRAIGIAVLGGAALFGDGSPGPDSRSTTAELLPPQLEREAPTPSNEGPQFRFDEPQAPVARPDAPKAVNI